jgi:hypothetical protein
MRRAQSPSPFEQMRWDKVDHCVRAVMARGTIPQGYMGKIKVDRASVREWWDAGAPVSGYWYALLSAVQAEWRALSEPVKPVGPVTYPVDA